MAEHCQNCNETLTGVFCSNCGQQKFKRIDKKYILDEFQEIFLQMNKGFLFSVKNIIINPGKTARGFIDGKRVNHYKPILLTFVLSGIATFLSYSILDLQKVMSAYYSEKHLDSKLMSDLMTILSSYNSIVMMLLIPFFAITTKIAFRKWGHNYYEHIVMNSYILSYYTLISIIFVYPSMFFFKDSSPSVFIDITQVSILVVPVILVWFFKGFYPDKSLKRIFLKVLAIIGLTVLGYLLFILIVGIGVAVYAIVNGTEALEYVKPK